MDRDMVAAVNLARRGRVRFARSRPPILLEAQGGAVEANEGEPDAYDNPWSRCPEANSSDEELTELTEVAMLIDCLEAAALRDIQSYVR